MSKKSRARYLDNKKKMKKNKKLLKPVIEFAKTKESCIDILAKVTDIKNLIIRMDQTLLAIANKDSHTTDTSIIQPVKDKVSELAKDLPSYYGDIDRFHYNPENPENIINLMTVASNLNRIYMELSNILNEYKEVIETADNIIQEERKAQIEKFDAEKKLAYEEREEIDVEDIDESEQDVSDVQTSESDTDLSRTSGRVIRGIPDSKIAHYDDVGFIQNGNTVSTVKIQTPQDQPITDNRSDTEETISSDKTNI